MEQLSPCATTTEPALSSLGAKTTEPTLHILKAAHPRARAPQQERPPQREAPTPAREEPPLATTREKLSQQQRPSTVNNKEINKII